MRSPKNRADQVMTEVLEVLAVHKADLLVSEQGTRLTIVCGGEVSEPITFPGATAHMLGGGGRWKGKKFAKPVG